MTGRAQLLAELEALRERLKQAEVDFELARYIDSYPRMTAERDHFARIILDLKSKITEAEAALAEREDAK